MPASILTTLTSKNKQLLVLAPSLSGVEIPDSFLSIVKTAFEQLAPFLKDNQQVLYVRDIPFLAIDDKYPGGHCYNRHEAMIAVKDWGGDSQQLTATINHELHHMARWQNAGYGDDLGGSIVSEGIATYYEELQSGWSAPWSQATFTEAVLADALENWASKNYSHSDWFFESERGRWLGYSIGYQLAKQLFKDGFDLERSLTLKSDEVKTIASELIPTQ